MDIVVCIKRVPDASEAELTLGADGKSVDGADLTWGLNEWDAFAVEEALRLKEAAGGGSVLAVTVGGEEDEEVLRRALAMGADAALHLLDPAFEQADALATARVLAAAIRSRPHDLVLTGAVTGDWASAQVGGLLAAHLDAPYVALATRTEGKGKVLEVQHEVEGGRERVVEVDLPAVVSIQTGINEPRYVSIRGIRKVAGVDIPRATASDLGLDTASLAPQVQLVDLFLPPAGGGAEMFEGDVDDAVGAVVARMREKGVL